MKEIYKAAERAFLEIPEDFRDWATVRVAEYFLQFGPNHGFKTPKGRWWGRKIMDDWYHGGTTPLSEFARGLFDGFNFNFEGLENLPRETAEILVVNQPNTGPLRGNWFKFLVNYAVAESRGRLGNYEACWVQGEISDSPVFRNTPIGIQKRRLSRMINKSCNTILVGSSQKDSKNPIIEMRRHLRDSGVLVICPEGKDSAVLLRGKKEVGELLLYLLQRTNIPIRPAAAWCGGTNLNLQFGKRIDLSSVDVNGGQKVADLAMIEIARLL